MTRSGSVFKGPFLLWDSVHSGYDVRKNIESYLIGLASVARRGVRCHPSRRETIVFHNSWSGGYYHWMTEALPRLFSLKGIWAESALLIPYYIPNRWFMPWLHEIGGFLEYVDFERGRNVLLRNAVLPKNPTRQDEFDVDNLRAVRTAILAAAGAGSSRKPHRLVYITRRNAKWRKVLNEEEIIDRLASIGFEIFDFDRLAYMDQVRTVAQAGILVSIHGAGLTNLMFMAPGTHVVEGAMRPSYPLTYNRLRKTHLVNPSYVRLAEVFEIKHRLVLCEVSQMKTPKRRGKAVNINDHDLIFDVEELMSTLRDIR